ncbi:hypothetical protein J0S82_017411 [Galemys pyrenaicus]|uniref:Uncharacterized protein n=1 Tax=Galemys pyrenaicus TaxID=202257 RepID=A0A8J5ZXM5_GALPY|nr:hypothetical protein J0S82_017411 [Galemys pyrenaicus]
MNMPLALDVWDAELELVYRDNGLLMGADLSLWGPHKCWPQLWLHPVQLWLWWGSSSFNCASSSKAVVVKTDTRWELVSESSDVLPK